MINRRCALRVSTALALLCGLALTAPAAYAMPAHDVPVLAADAKDLGRADPAHEMKLTVMLKHHDEDGLRAAIDAMYTPGSPSFRHWLTQSQLVHYAPTQAEFDAVKTTLVRQGYEILALDPHRLSIRVKGNVAITEKAFQTTLHQYTYHGKGFIAHTVDAQLAGPAGAYVDAVAGLDQHGVHPMFSIAKNPETGKAIYQKPLTKAIAKTLASTISNVALGLPVTNTYGSGATTATYTGAVYSPSGLPICNTPQQLQAYYGMLAVYAAGYTGKGQTIAVIDGYGYSAELADANTFSSIFKLPQLTTTSLTTVYPEGIPSDPSAGDLTGWTTEISLDIQSVHTLAPDANIVVVASNGQDNEDLITSMQYVINNKISYNVSNSWEADTDLVAGPEELNAFNNVLEMASAQGFAFQFSSGDGGAGGLTSAAGAPGVPSDSPYATAVGGTSILNNPATGAFIPTGWGNNFSAIVDNGALQVPGSNTTYFGGAGGGSSIYFAKPKWQAALPGAYRQVPDVAALADPYTGVVTISTVGGVQNVIEGLGGTSLASPLFTAIWAIAGQYAGSPRGQAGPYLSHIAVGDITDVVPLTSLNATDVSGIYVQNGKTYKVSPISLFGTAALEGTVNFVSAFFPPQAGQPTYAISFGTDTLLGTEPGWDNVTGYGEPNGLPFIQGVSK